MNIMSDVPTRSRDPLAIDLQTYDARQLINNGVQARIILDDQVYYLRITRAGKLILTK